MRWRSRLLPGKGGEPGLDGSAPGLLVVAESEVVRRGCEASQVLFEAGDAAARAPEQGLEERERRAWVRERPGLGEALLVLRRRRRVPDHAAADGVFDLPAVAVDDRRADRHREAGAALRRHPADGSAVDAARPALEPCDPFHGPRLGRPGHRGAREERRKDLRQRRGRSRRDRGRHLPNGRIALERHEALDFDTAGRGDPAEVVAHHVDDHQILGALLRRTGELRGLAIILCRESTPASGALHRAHDQAITLPREEELRGERDDGRSAAVEEGSVRRGARGRQTARTGLRGRR